MKATTRLCAVLLAFCAGFAAPAADDTGETARVRLIAGLGAEKAYMPRLLAIRALERETPFSVAERSALLAFLRRTDGLGGADETEPAALKNDVAEHLLGLPDMPGGFARDLLDMQADPAQSATWRNYCVQFLRRTYAATPGPALRKEVRERLRALAEAADPETCGTALIALASLCGNPEIDARLAGDRAMAVALDAAKPEGLRLTALQAAAGLGHASAAPAARVWLAVEKSAGLRAAAIGVLGTRGGPADRALIEPYLRNPDPRLSGAARAALKLPRKGGRGGEPMRPTSAMSSPAALAALLLASALPLTTHPRPRPRTGSSCPSIPAHLSRRGCSDAKPAAKAWGSRSRRPPAARRSLSSSRFPDGALTGTMAGFGRV